MEAINQRKTHYIAEMIRRNISELRKSGADIGKEANEVFDMIDDLAVELLKCIPPRNCDVGSAEAQVERFKNFCRNHQFISADSEDGFPPVYVCSNESCPLHDYYIAHGEDNCELAWAQKPYEEGVPNAEQKEKIC